MLAYHSNEAIKTDILAQLEQHRAADQLVKGQYWKNGKGCAVACTIHSGNHAEYEPRFGIPQVLAHLEDRIFEGLPNAEAQQWPVRFMGAIKVGADLSNVWPQFAVWLLTDETFGALSFAENDARRAIIKEVADLYARGEKDKAVWRKIADRAWKIYGAAGDAAYAAVAAADAAYAAADAAYAAADAAYAAADAADAAARRRRATRSVGDGSGSGGVGGGVGQPPETFQTARDKHYVAQSNKLIALLEAA